MIALSAGSLAVGSLFVFCGLMTGEQWVQLVAYVLGLHAAGTAGVTVAKPAGEYLAASAQKILSRDRESG
jgi:hypothetical protein